MGTMDNIHDAQDQVAGLQAQLDEVQNMLDKAEHVAAAGEESIKRRGRCLFSLKPGLLCAVSGI